MNSTRMFCTAHRGCSERGFASDWQHKITGGRYQIPRQYLDRYNKPPTPDVSVIHVLIALHFAIQDMTATPTTEVNCMPDGVSLADVYRGGLERIEWINWLDPLRTGEPSPFHRPNLFAGPSVRELNLGWRNNGGVRLVNIFNPVQTGFPVLTTQQMNEFCGGPYLVHLARSYLSSARVKAADRLAYIDLATHHRERRRSNQYMMGFVFDQLLPPHNWFGIWPGCTVANTEPWQPVRILVLPKLPSRYKANCEHTVVIAFVPEDLTLRHPTPGFSCESLQRIRMWICGPR